MVRHDSLKAPPPALRSLLPQAKAFDAWLTAAETRRRMQRYAGRLLQSAVVRVWYTWLESADQTKQNALRMRRVLQRLLHAGMARALSTWQTEAEACKRKLACLRKFAFRIMHRNLVAAWGSWEERLAEQRVMRKFVARMLNRGLGRAWEQWRDVLAGEVRLQRFARRMLFRQTGRAWEQWLAVCAEMARVRAFGYRMKNAGLVAAFNSWVEARLLARRQRRVLRRLTRASLARAWNSWATAADEAVAAARVLARSARRWQQSAVGRAWRAWLEAATERRRRLALIRTAMLRMLALRLAKVFDAWYRAVSATQERRQLLFRKAANLLRHPLLTRTFYAWRGVFDSSRGAEARLRTALNMWTNRLLTQCFRSWDDATTAVRALRRKAVARFRDALLAQAFTAWVAEVRRRRGNERLLRDALLKMTRRLLVLTFRGWRDAVARKNDLVGWAATRWASAALVRGFDRWRDLSQEGRRLMQIGRRVLRRVTHALLSRCLLAWAGLVASEAARQRENQRRAMATLSGRADMVAQMVLEAWAAWASAEARRRTQLAAKFYGRYMNQLLTKVFVAWSASTSRERESRRMLQLRTMSMVASTPEMLMTLAFETLRKHVADRKREREALVRTALIRMQKGMLHACFHAWADAVPERGTSGGGGGGGGNGGDGGDVASGPLVAALQDEVAALRAMVTDLTRQLATQERSKAYRFEVSQMRDELHSFLFQGGGLPAPQLRPVAFPPSSGPIVPSGLLQPTPLVPSHSQSDESDDDGAEDVPSRRAGGASGRPRTGGPVGPAARPPISGAALVPRAERPRRPHSARASVAASHEWPVTFTGGQRATSPTAIVGGGASTAAAPEPDAPPMRARPPSSSRPSTADRRSPRVRMVSTQPVANAPEAPLFSCASMKGGSTTTTTSLSWAQRNHFAQVLPPVT